MAALAILKQKVMLGLDNASYVVTQVRHDGTTAGTYTIDQSAQAVGIVPLDGQTVPSVSLGSEGSSSTFLKTVTINGLTGLCDVLTRHQGAISSVKA